MSYYKTHDNEGSGNGLFFDNTKRFHEYVSINHQSFSIHLTAISRQDVHP